MNASTTESKVIELYKSAPKIYPKSVSGRFARLRVLTLLATQFVFYGLAWLQWNGRQAVLFDLAERKFYVFGWIFWPQDVLYLTFILIVSAYGLFFVTAIAGRVFCGYACPQTVYSEMFMWVERWFEGDRAQRMKLDRSPWSLEKALRKGGKHGVWIVIALWTGFTFVGYFTPIRELVDKVPTLSTGPWETFWILFYGFATWGNAGFMREQVCKYMCPYARFQSVMFDRDTMIVTYDRERGEPRGGRKKGVDAAALGLGACIDCSLCVQVCPTGIDIRNGLQYECIGCAACIDVCDGVMDKMGYERGLVRYATENAIDHRWGWSEMRAHILRPRIIIYGTLLALLVTGLGASLALRNPLKVDVIRDRRVLAREVEGRWIENVYRLNVMNTGTEPRSLRIHAEGIEGIQIARGGELSVPAVANTNATIAVRIPVEQAMAGSHPIRLRVESAADGRIAIEEKSTFIVPH